MVPPNCAAPHCAQARCERAEGAAEAAEAEAEAGEGAVVWVELPPQGAAAAVVAGRAPGQGVEAAEEEQGQGRASDWGRRRRRRRSDPRGWWRRRSRRVVGKRNAGERGGERARGDCSRHAPPRTVILRLLTSKRPPMRARRVATNRLLFAHLSPHLRPLSPHPSPDRGGYVSHQSDRPSRRDEQIRRPATELAQSLAEGRRHRPAPRSSGSPSTARRGGIIPPRREP